MKKVLLSFTFLLFMIGLAQAQTRRPGGGMGQGQERQGGRNMGAAMGLIKYEAEEALKKMKIEEEALSGTITQLIGSYNSQIDSLRADSRPLFAEMREQIRSIRQSGDFSQMRSMREQSRQKLAPVREQAQLIQSELDTQLEPLLNKKQLKKWKSYKAAKRPVPRGPGN
jgi:predicted CopG family antitoxin